jgi:hypothetical protein
VKKQLFMKRYTGPRTWTDSQERPKQILGQDRDQWDSRDSSVGIALGYGLYDRSFRVRFPEGAGNFFLHHRVQNGSGVHPESYPMATVGSFPGGKAAGA